MPESLWGNLVKIVFLPQREKEKIWFPTGLVLGLPAVAERNRTHLKLSALFQQIAGDKHARNELERPLPPAGGQHWQSLNWKYAELQQEYQRSRRHFSVSVAVPYTDVRPMPVPVLPGKHL